MPLEDASRWNTRYKERIDKNWIETPRRFLTENARYLPSTGLALDIAMGMGSNANFLLSRGLRVIGVDVSEVGVRASMAKFPALMGVVADLTYFYLPENKFDVILNFYYLQRELWPEYTRALRPGGVLYFETMTERMLEGNQDINPHHLLATGELAKSFPTLEKLFYEEIATEEDSRITLATARLIARKPF